MSFQLKIHLSAKKKDSHIVLALDLPYGEPNLLLHRSMQILEETHSTVCAVKINRQLVLPLGLYDGIKKILNFAHDLGMPTIMDCKINDVGHTNRMIAEYYYKAGFDAVTANPFIGWKEGLQPVFEIATQMQRGVILLTYMSHKAADEGYGQIVYDNDTGDLNPQYLVFADRALSWNADGVVVGATFPEKIEEVHGMLGEKVPIYSPGIGVQGGNIEATIKAGARYLIVGRTITLSEKPIETTKYILNVVKHCLK